MAFGQTPDPNDLGRVITNPTVRSAVYATFVVLLVVAGAVTIAFATLGSGIPQWVAVTNAVLGYLGIPVGGLAIANVGTTPPVVADRGE